MKKKLTLLFITIFAGIIIFGTTVFAERMYECPVTITRSTGTTGTINKFEVTKVENLPGKYLNRIHYIFEESGTCLLDVICYNNQGLPIKTVDFNQYMDYIDVPDTTAMIELVDFSPEKYTNSLFYSNYINVYSADGRVMGITDLQLPIYEMVGWYSEVTMYADDGRTFKISPFQVDDYQKVGWYTWDAFLFKGVQNLYNEYKAEKDYNAILGLVEYILPDFIGTKYEQDLYAIRTEAMDLWRKSSNSPLPYVEYALSENSIGTPEAKIWFTNVSYKPIIAFKVKFTCYNVFGELENTYYNHYFADDLLINPAETYWVSWTLNGADSVNTITNIRVTEVVFSDGTKWVR